jgi:hypothetical protein
MDSVAREVADRGILEENDDRHRGDINSAASLARALVQFL